jgi:hypothetical protein
LIDWFLLGGVCGVVVACGVGGWVVLWCMVWYGDVWCCLLLHYLVRQGRGLPADWFLVSGFWFLVSDVR